MAKAYDPDEIIDLYTKNANTQKSLEDDALNAYIGKVKADEPVVTKMYSDARSGVYSASRLSAIGNNEVLANQGLAGNAYTAPKSGYSETSRVYQDVSMQNNLSNLSYQERSAFQSLSDLIYTQYATTQKNKAAIDLDLSNKVAEEQLKAKTSQDEITAAYTANEAALQNALDTGSFTIADAKYLLATDGITQETYDNLVGQYKTQTAEKVNTDYETALVSGSEENINAALAAADTAKKSGLMEEADYNKLYYNYVKSGIETIKLDSLGNYDTVLSDIEAYKENLGNAKYKTALSQLKSQFTNAYYGNYAKRVSDAKSIDELKALKTELVANKDKMTSSVYTTALQKVETKLTAAQNKKNFSSFGAGAS